MTKKVIKSLEVGIVDNGISIGLRDKQGLFIRKGKYVVLKVDL